MSLRSVSMSQSTGHCECHFLRLDRQKVYQTRWFASTTAMSSATAPWIVVVFNEDRILPVVLDHDSLQFGYDSPELDTLRFEFHLHILLIDVTISKMKIIFNSPPLLPTVRRISSASLTHDSSPTVIELYLLSTSRFISRKYSCSLGPFTKCSCPGWNL